MKNILAENMQRFGTKNLTESDIQRLNEGATPWEITDPTALNITPQDLQPIVSKLQSILKNKIKVGIHVGKTQYRASMRENAAAYYLTVADKEVPRGYSSIYNVSLFHGVYPVLSKSKQDNYNYSDALLNTMKKYNDKDVLKDRSAQIKGGNEHATIHVKNIFGDIIRTFGIKPKRTEGADLARTFARMLGPGLSPLNTASTTVYPAGKLETSNQMDQWMRWFFDNIADSTDFGSFIEFVNIEAKKIASAKVSNYVKANGIPFTGLLPM